MKWIKVSDQKPPKDTRFLYDNGERITIATWHDIPFYKNLLKTTERDYCRNEFCAQNNHYFLFCEGLLDIQPDHYWLPLLNRP